MPAWNFIETLAAEDYLEVVWQSGVANTVFEYVAATGNIPQIPSIITTLVQVR